MRAAVLVPVKAFGAAKRRLQPVLTPAERADLARAMAAQVLAAAEPLPAHVVCDDDEVAAWARGQGAEVLWRPGLGLNGAVADGVATLHARGFDHVVVAHADLPLAHDLAGLVRPGRLLLVPDRRDDGTNVLALPAGMPFRFAYGAGSFRRHAAEGHRLGLAVGVRRDPALGLDIDTPDDLASIEEVFLWQPTSPVSPR